MKDLSRRTADFTDSVIRRMTRISNRYGAVNLSQGFPDFDPPKALLDRLAQVSYEDFHQYSITCGAPGLPPGPAEKQSRFMGRTIDPEREIVATAAAPRHDGRHDDGGGAPGDKVIVFSPFYENYGGGRHSVRGRAYLRAPGPAGVPL